jgi:hypothetical protein
VNSIFSHLNLVYTFATCSSGIHSILPWKCCMHLEFPHVWPTSLLNLITLTMLCEECKLQSFSLCNFLYTLLYIFFYPVAISLQTQLNHQPHKQVAKCLATIPLNSCQIKYLYNKCLDDRDQNDCINPCTSFLNRITETSQILWNLTMLKSHWYPEERRIHSTLYSCNWSESNWLQMSIS